MFKLALIIIITLFTTAAADSKPEARPIKQGHQLYCTHLDHGFHTFIGACRVTEEDVKAEAKDHERRGHSPSWASCTYQ